MSLTGVCSVCWKSLEPWRGPACAGCGLPFASALALDAAEARCADCRAEEMAFDRARSFGLYRDALRAALLLLKFQRRERLGIKLGALLVEAWDALWASRDVANVLVVPVPLHSVRQRERGYNQADLLARGLAEKLAKSRRDAGLRFARGVLTKIKATPPQSGLSRSARRENVRGAFAVPVPERVRDRVIVVVDDVMTTGATLSACASVLKRAGAREVLAVTLARATPQFPDSGPQGDPVAVDEFAAGRP
ncbi:MAG: ComF family protein [Acidobacteria bacterium]|nr:ComF family protein [Acidobacteriota bacterium]